MATQTMSSPRELFLHELGDMLYAEQTLLKALPKLQRESRDDELVKGIERHIEETRGHVENVKAAFDRLGEKAKAERCPGIEGITKEHDEFVSEEKPSPEIRDMFNTGAAARAEHYEIAGYTGLVTMAKELGEREVAGLLEEILKEEKAMLSDVEKIAKRLAKEGAKTAAK